jgi:hypothetical protein
MGVRDKQSRADWKRVWCGLGLKKSEEGTVVDNVPLSCF